MKEKCNTNRLVERQILGSNPSLSRSGTTSYSFHFIGTITDFLFAVQGTSKGSKREKSKKKKIADKEGTCNKERLWLNFEVNKEDKRVFLDVALRIN
nr:hypothetical protein CFP56_67119 [Quercus suber]